ncbi:hypothetical protein [Geomonas ferrireducens]|uniref:hypothetical protein n=1 Tax=Geomonas ferrireducens TaxID=2570227 RepID=UPI0010A78D79|nr:hypothetical protein [Geomonas ferrireducens]
MEVMKPEMDATEKTALDHLRYRGFENVMYEPNGKSTVPDFVIVDRIAVEVRRLNQNEIGSSIPKGLEHAEFRLIQKFNKILKSLEQSSGWWVLLRFKRPVPKGKQIEAAVRSFISSLPETPEKERLHLSIGRNLNLEFWKKGNGLDKTIELGSVCDLDEGGFVIPEMERNLRLCIDEKTKKISNIKSQYEKYWLILVDHLAYGMSEYSRKLFRENVCIEHQWDKITILNPLDPTDFFDL